MSSEYYFKQWKRTLNRLEEIVALDLHYQETKAHDKTWCDASLRLSSVLGGYIACYNKALECLHYNLQVQKTGDIQFIVNSIAARILELREQLRKHQGCYHQFISSGLITHKLTPYDAELSDIPEKQIQPDNIKKIILEAFQQAQQIKDKKESIENLNVLLDEENNDWWNEPDDSKNNEDAKHVGINIGAIYEVHEVVSEETLYKRKIICLIQAQERSRQFILKSNLEKQKRITWEKELKGTLNPHPRLELKKRAAKLIQRGLRCYFEIKRTRIRESEYEKLMDIQQCRKPCNGINANGQICISKKYNEYYEAWENECTKLRSDFMKKRGSVVAEDFRDFMREWFKQWFDEAKFFLDLPKENQGGLSAVLKEQLPSPSEWLEQYEIYLEQKKANKNKTATELKWEKKEAEREQMMLKRKEMRKKKREADLLKKIMKNPKMHPGYKYLKSKKSQNIIKALEEYKKKWGDLDELDVKHVKEGFCKEVDINNIHAIANEEILITIEEDMREELKILKQALKEDYTRNEEVMPENMKQNKKFKRVKKQRAPKKANENIILEMLTELATKEILVAYPATRFEDFFGEYNYAGDDLICDLKSTQPLRGEAMSSWWERCRDLTHGHKKILLVGPRSSGKTVLVHAMASVNEATLYDINLLQFYEEPEERLKKLIADLLICAKTTQPSVIYIRHVHRLYFRRTQPNEVNLNSTLFKRLIIKRLLKKIHGNDKVCVIGSCVDPWLTNSKQMTKHFPNILMIPPTSYTTTQLILQKWVLDNRVVPPTLDTQSLAHVLQGYLFGYLQKTLEEFLSSEQIVKIAAYGLTSVEIYDYFLQNQTETKVDYEKYNKWYFEKSHWGIVERKHLEERIEFKNVLERWKEKEDNKKRTS